MAYQRPIAPIAQRVGRNGVDQLAPLLGIKHRGLAGFHDMLRTAHGCSRVHRHDLAGDQPVEQHAHGRQLLFHVRRRMGQLARLYIGGDIMRPDRRQRQAALVAPGEEADARTSVSAARIRVADVDGEEFDVAPGGRVAGVGDQRRHQAGVGVLGQGAGLSDGGELGFGHLSPPHTTNVVYDKGRCTKPLRGNSVI